ncbi:RNA polymerase sigma factor [Kutzneria chonburiensis]|uniref:RNA polymerase sigma factor n=1 Tax=Kutzneria chonburiensis TaxID=1483604 RepID=A0ABV6N3H3_9PSEU|nr:sigma-70 family RNA polymerase sigma factor [Kutzneria chonburiensis]
MNGLGDLLRELTPQVLAALVRRYGHFDTAEDAVQEALLAAAQQWPAAMPDDPKAWLITVASRRLTDLLRSNSSRQLRESRWVPPEQHASADDDSLVLLFLCCHPSLSPSSQIALTLRAVGGLTTAEIARAFLVPEATMTRRISRAKQAIKASGVPFGLPADDRLPVVLHVLYLIFNEGYASTAGPSLHRVELSAEAIRLTRMVRRLRPDDAEVAGLLALMLLTDARRPARTGPHGELVPMAEQDRNLWHAKDISEGVDLVTAALSKGAPGPYQLQAAIAAVHDEAPSYAETDWPQIVGLYELLRQISPDNPVLALNNAVAVAMVDGPTEGLALLDDRLGDDHRLHSVRAHLLELSGDHAAAQASYREAARRAMSLPQQRYLNARADRLTDG